MIASDPAFERFCTSQTHDHGTPKGQKAAKAIAMDNAIVALLPELPNVKPEMIQAWMMGKYGFRASTITVEYIDEHCLYQAGKPGTATKQFPQPKQNAALRIVNEGVYGLPHGVGAYVRTTRSHGNK